MLASWQPLSSQPNPPNPRFAPTATAPTLPPPAVPGYDPFAQTGSPFGREVYNTGRLESLGLPADTFNRSNPATGTGLGASTLPTTTGSFSNPLPQAPPLAVVHSNQWLAPTLAVIAGAGTLATAIKKPTVFTEVLPNAFLSLQGKMGQWFSQSGDILSKQGAEAVQQTSDDLAEQGSKVLSTVTPPPSSPVPVIHHVVQQAVESDAEKLAQQQALEAQLKAGKQELAEANTRHAEALNALTQQNTQEAQRLQQQVAFLKTEADSLKQQHAHALQQQEASLKQTSEAQLKQLEQQLQQQVTENKLTQEQLSQQLAQAKQEAQQQLDTALASTRQAHAQALQAKEEALQQATATLKQTEAQHQAKLQEVQQGFNTQLASVTSKHQAEQAKLTQQLKDLQTELATHKQQYHNAMQEVTTAYDALQRLGNLMQEGDALAKRAEALASRQAEVLQQQATEASTAQKGGLFGKAKQFVKGQVERNMHGDEAAQTRNVLSNPNAGNIDPLKAERDALMKERDVLQQRYATLKQQADEAIGKQNAFLTRQAHAEGNEPQLLTLWQSNTPHPTLAPMEAVLQRLNQALENAMP